MLFSPPQTRYNQTLSRAKTMMPAHGRILVVERDEPERRGIVHALKTHGYTVSWAPDADKAMSYLHEGIDVVLCDARLNGLSGLDLLVLWKKHCPRTQFILIAGQSSVEDAVAAIKAGACDYVIKPQSHDKLTLLVRHALEVNGHEESSAQREALRLSAMRHIVGQSPLMQHVFARIERAAPVDSTVLILGENGTGKELVARALHESSPRHKGPLSPPSPPPWSKANFSATSAAPSPALPTAASAALSKPTAEPSSSTRSATLSWPFSPSCCASWKRSPSPLSEGTRTGTSMSGSSPPPAATSPRWSATAASGKTCTTA
jgi:CheY-like chemotaxis protein